MPIIPPNQGFQPSREALMRWLGTRKQPQIAGSVTLPGLFHTYNFQKDERAFFTVILLELLGLFALIVAWRRLDTVAIGVLFSFLLIDLVSAWRLHKNKYKFCLLENKKILNDDPRFISILEHKLSGEKIIIIICKIIIIGIALMKIWAYTVLSYQFNGITFAIILIYSIIAMIHIYNTGYCLAEWNTSRLIKRDYKKFLKILNPDGSSELEAKPYFDTIENILLNQHKVNQHSLEKISENPMKYKFQATGVLTDNELMDFVIRQEEDSNEKVRIKKTTVAEKGLGIQLQILHEN